MKLQFSRIYVYGFQVQKEYILLSSTGSTFLHNFLFQIQVALCLELPYNDYFEYYSNDFKLHIVPSNMTNLNTPDYLQKVQ